MYADLEPQSDSADNPFLASCIGPSLVHRSVRNTVIATVMDIMTDILVLSFPLALLWKVRINMHQKFGLGVVLCLSIVMIIIAAVRIAGIKRSNGEIDTVWLVFWQQQECSTALTMVCVSAFRSLLVPHATGNRPNGKNHFSPSYWRQRLMRQRLNSIDEERNGGLPQIPRATLTGMSTMIRETRLSTL